MFADLPAPPVDPSPIWGQPLSERISTLLRRRRRVAWIYRSPDTSTFRYRAANMVAAVNADESSEVSAAWFSETELAAIAHLIPRLDRIVVVRYPMSGPLLRFLDRARHHQVPLVFDSDDMVFDPQFVPLVMDAIGTDTEDFASWVWWYSYTAQLEASMSWCQSGFTTGAALQEKMGPYFGARGARVIPNFLDRRQQGYSRQLLEAKMSRRFARRGPVSIGYFSGTATHGQDFAMVIPALSRLLRSDPQVRLRVVGRLDVAGAFDDVADQIDIVPFMDYLALPRAIAEVEINLAPLQHHLFTACKSELKYFEAAAVGTWTAASALPAFQDAIEHGVTGALVRAHEWDDALAEAVDLARDTAAYAERAEIAAERVYARYGWDRQSEHLSAALASC